MSTVTRPPIDSSGIRWSWISRIAPAGTRPQRPRRRPVVGWSVRLDWPGGRHHLVGFHANPDAAADQIPGLRAFWARGPRHPNGYRVVRVDHDAWARHPRHGCARSDCPR